MTPREIAADGVQHTWPSYSQTLRHVILAAEASAWLDRIVCPVHFVVGDSDPVVDHAYLRRLAGTHANVELSERPGHHDLPFNQPAECSASIG